METGVPIFGYQLLMGPCVWLNVHWEDIHIYYKRRGKASKCLHTCYHKTEVKSIPSPYLGFQQNLFAKKGKELSCNIEGFDLGVQDLGISLSHIKE